MNEADQIPRVSLAWLLITQAVILAPHGVHVPILVWALWIFVVFWRWQIFRGAWGYPDWKVKLVLVSVSCVGLYFAYRGSFGMQTMVGWLVVGYILKLVEMRKKSDLLLLSHLGFFVVATQFLFFSNVLAAIYGFICFVLIAATLLASHQSLDQRRFWRTLLLTKSLVLQAVPLMLLLFLVVPRVGALWAVPMNTAGAKSGMSETMSPGDISQLMLSKELVFRVTFEDQPPRSSQLYWRGLVFSYFDGRRWSQSQRQISFDNVNWPEEPRPDWRRQMTYAGAPTRYEIIIEPTRQPWLFTLDAPREWDVRAGINRELHLQARRPIGQRTQYRVTSHLDYQLGVHGLEPDQQRQSLQLPRSSNPRTREIAQQWLAEAGSQEALIKRLLAFYHDKFIYTLQPPALGENTVDEFLWGTQQGFCEHFSSSFVFFMRAAGIPARVVVGYQGGEYNPVENYYAVRQREAHAWAEVWLEDKGWITVDPTAAVAPERIEQGADFSLNEEDTKLLNDSYFNKLAVFSVLRLRWEALNYNWSRWVLGYDANLQSELLKRLLGGLDIWRLALFVVISGIVIIGGITLFLLWNQRRRFARPEDRHYWKFCQKLAKAGFNRQPGEAPRNYAQRVSVVRSDLKSSVERITALFEAISYGEGDPSLLGELRQTVNQFRVLKVRDLEKSH